MSNYYLFWLALSVSVLIHELGHAAAMKLLKIPIRLIRWGFGPLLFRIGLFEMRLVPIFGFADAKIRDWSGCEWKGILVGVSGVIVQWIVLIVMKVDGICVCCTKLFCVVVVLLFGGISAIFTFWEDGWEDDLEFVDFKNETLNGVFKKTYQ